jgi:Domain of unknown function (DUF4389)
VLAGALFGSGNVNIGRGASRSYNYNFGIADAAALLGWFACLAVARMPRGLRDCVVWGVGFAAQLWGYLFMLTDRYPDCDPEVVIGELPAREDEIAITLEPGLHRSRLTVFFRLLLAFPHLVWLTLWGVLAIPVLVAAWLATLARGQLPDALHAFLARYLRCAGQLWAFLGLVANPFPGFAGAPGTYPTEVDIAAPRRQNRWTVGFRLLLALPAWLLAASYGSLLLVGAVLGWFAALITGRMPRRLHNSGAHALRYAMQAYGYAFLLTGAYPYGGPCRFRGMSAPEPAAASAFG